MKEIIYTHWRNRDINDIKGEEWRFITNTNKRYSVSSFGRVKSNRVIQGLNGTDSIFNICPLICKQHMVKGGYLRVSIGYKKEHTLRMVHTIVCSEFHKNILNKKEVNHIKNVRHYNVASNLEWATRSENISAIHLNKGIEYTVIDIIKPENSIYNVIQCKPDKFFIYAITNHKNKVVYTGKAANPITRFRQHKTSAKHPVQCKRFNLIWLRDILLLGEPSIIILKEVGKDEWEYWEKYYINLYRSKGELFNISDGGHDISPKAKIKFSQANEERKVPVLQYGLDGTFIKEWDYIGLAWTTLKITKQNIIRCLKNKRPSAAGYLWQYKQSEKYPLKIEPYAPLRKHNKYQPKI